MQKMNVWIFGQPCSGKTTIANLLYNRLEQGGLINSPHRLLDGDAMRKLFDAKGYIKKDRYANVERISDIALFLDNAVEPDTDKCVTSIASVVTPYEDMRKSIRDKLPNTLFVYLEYNNLIYPRGREHLHVKDFEYPQETGEMNFERYKTHVFSENFIVDHIIERIVEKLL